MTRTFEALCMEFALPKQQGDARQRAILSQWCLEHISQDLVYRGPIEEEYSYYQALAEHYLDGFLAHVPSNLEEPLSLFSGLNAIQYAAYRGYSQFITSLPTTCSLDRSTASGMTGLHLAAASGYYHTVQALLALGASPFIINAQGQLPLHSALLVPVLHDDGLMERKADIFRALLAVDPHTITAQDESGDTVCHLLAAFGFDGLLSEVMARHGQDACHKNNQSHYPIHIAILNNQVGAAQVLLSLEAVATLADAEGRVALHYAAKYGTKGMVLLCCSATPDINVQDGARKTPLLVAVEVNNREAIQVLLEQDADVSIKDYQGFSILHYAVLSKDITLVRYILENTAADVNVRDGGGRIPQYYARELALHEIVPLLEARNA